MVLGISGITSVNTSSPTPSLPSTKFSANFTKTACCNGKINFEFWRRPACLRVGVQTVKMLKGYLSTPNCKAEMGKMVLLPEASASSSQLLGFLWINKLNTTVYTIDKLFQVWSSSVGNDNHPYRITSIDRTNRQIVSPMDILSHWWTYLNNGHIISRMDKPSHQWTYHLSNGYIAPPMDILLWDVNTFPGCHPQRIFMITHIERQWCVSLAYDLI